MNDRLKGILVNLAPVVITMVVTLGGVYGWHLLHLAPASPPPPPIAVPSSLSVAPGDIATLEADTTGGGKAVQWFSASKEVKLFPLPPANRVIVHARKPGVYHVVAIGLDSKSHVAPPAICELTVGQPGPNPGPAPGPTPGPSDPLSQKLQAAYASETAPDKAATLAALAEVYSQGASAATSRTDVTTWGDFFNVLEAGAKAGGVNGKIMGVQEVIMAELKKTLPSSKTASLDDPGRKLASSALQRIAAALKNVR